MTIFGPCLLEANPEGTQMLSFVVKISFDSKSSYNKITSSSNGISLIDIWIAILKLCSHSWMLWE